MIYPGDHARPHFHLIGPDCAIVFEIEGLSWVRGVGPDVIVNEALARAANEKATLLAKWDELNERDDE